MTTGIAWDRLDPIKRAQLLYLLPELRAEEQRHREAKERILEGLMDDQRLKELEEDIKRRRT